ncbi:MAG: nickel pincer cofactor biosynthesis protein LarC [Eubacteriaceae bacterium]|nr:nickel pincer cofactor biosynthesis protein LarC [Eubacteriaceae bacterium]
MRILYYDCFSGISGDMNLGAMIHLGVDREYLIKELSGLKIENEFELKINNEIKMGIAGIKADVILKKHEHVHRHINDIESIIDGSDLNDQVKAISKKIFLKIAQAEAKVHGKTIEEIHFHEVGATDSIVDIVGAAICFDYLKPDKIISSSVQLGGGFVKCAHGMIPVPAPATVEILKGKPVRTGLVGYETTTPTGAAILAAMADEFTNEMNFTITSTGYGLGTKDFEVPNVLRVHLAELTEDAVSEEQLMLEANIDDMNPEFYSFLEEKLFQAGALDVYKTSIIMKKGRPAIKLSILCKARDEELVIHALFLHSTTIGARKYPVGKIAMDRKIIEKHTSLGTVRVKQTYYQGELIRQKLEYEDCLKIAREKDMTLDAVYAEAAKTTEDSE